MLTGKFELLKELGTIKVPAGYEHRNHLSVFRKKYRRRFWYYDKDIIDRNFMFPSRVLRPGDELRVIAFQQIVPVTTSSQERVAFLATEKSVFPGAQGISLVFEQMKDHLPKGMWYSSFDEGPWVRGDTARYGVPCLAALAAGSFDFDLGAYNREWEEGHAFLCYCLD